MRWRSRPESSAVASAPERGRAHLGIGAFNLVRLSAFRGIGGFEHLTLSVDDDNRLAQAIVAAGYRGRAILGKGAVSVRWHTGLGGLIRGLEKNLFAFVDFRAPVVVVASLLWLGMCAPYVALFVGPWWVQIDLRAGDCVGRCDPGSDPATDRYRVVLRIGSAGWRCRLSLCLYSVDVAHALARGRSMARPTLPAVRSQRARAHAKRVVAIDSNERRQSRVGETHHHPNM